MLTIHSDVMHGSQIAGSADSGMGGSTRVAPGGARRVNPLDLSGELARHVGQFGERAGDRAERDALERFPELGHRRVETLPLLLRAASRRRAGAQLVRELHVPRAGAAYDYSAGHYLSAATTASINLDNDPAGVSLSGPTDAPSTAGT